MQRRQRWAISATAALAALTVVTGSAMASGQGGGGTPSPPPQQSDPIAGSTYSGAYAQLGFDNRIAPGNEHDHSVPPGQGPSFYGTAHTGPPDGTPCLTQAMSFSGVWPTLGPAQTVPVPGSPGYTFDQRLVAFDYPGDGTNLAGWYTFELTDSTNDPTTIAAAPYYHWIGSYAEMSGVLASGTGHSTWLSGVCSSGQYDPQESYLFYPVGPQPPQPPPPPPGVDPTQSGIDQLLRRTFPVATIRSNVPPGGNFTVFAPGCFWLDDGTGGSPSETSVTKSSDPQWGYPPASGPPTVYAFTYTIALDPGTISWDFGDGRGSADGTGTPDGCSVTHTYKQVSDVLVRDEVAPADSWGVAATSSGVTVTAVQQVSARAFYQYWDGTADHFVCWTPRTRSWLDVGSTSGGCAPFDTVTIGHRGLGPVPVYQVITVPYTR